jgi:tRNA-splicing ligase RtcB (3'-phosphate/5'-hydroxy nucleic acid ligase)
MQEIIDNIGDTVDIVNIIKPIYNFKASEESDNRRNKHSKK